MVHWSKEAPFKKIPTNVFMYIGHGEQQGLHALTKGGIYGGHDVWALHAQDFYVHMRSGIQCY
jgi:hypothetical protein